MIHINNPEDCTGDKWVAVLHNRHLAVVHNLLRADSNRVPVHCSWVVVDAALLQRRIGLESWDANSLEAGPDIAVGRIHPVDAHCTRLVGIGCVAGVDYSGHGRAEAGKIADSDHIHHSVAGPHTVRNSRNIDRADRAIGLRSRIGAVGRTGTETAGCNLAEADVSAGLRTAVVDAVDLADYMFRW